MVMITFCKYTNSPRITHFRSINFILGNLYLSSTHKLNWLNLIMENRKSGELSFKMTDRFSSQWGHLLSFQIPCNGNRIIFKGNKNPQRKRTPPVKSDSAGGKHIDRALYMQHVFIYFYGITTLLLFQSLDNLIPYSELCQRVKCHYNEIKNVYVYSAKNISSAYQDLEV